MLNCDWSRTGFLYFFSVPNALLEALRLSNFGIVSMGHRYFQVLCLFKALHSLFLPNIHVLYVYSRRLFQTLEYTCKLESLMDFSQQPTEHACRASLWEIWDWGAQSNFNFSTVSLCRSLLCKQWAEFHLKYFPWAAQYRLFFLRSNAQFFTHIYSNYFVTL